MIYLLIFTLGLVAGILAPLFCLKNWTAIGAIGTILIPVILTIWSVYSEKQKEKRENARIKEKNRKQSIKDEKNFLISFIKEEMYPLEIDKYNFEHSIENEELHEMKIKKWIANYGMKLSDLIKFSIYTTYEYIIEYITILQNIKNKIIEDETITVDELDNTIVVFSNHVKIIILFLGLDAEKYIYTSKISINAFVEKDDKIRKITLDVLKDYPLYYEAVKKHIEEQEKALAPTASSGVV